ncbi:MAG: KpsF/GutQ family sugar-phosphate isomerase [Alphaproteobacteria bacterium]|nr:MAG: KpsF/GutQ family sugar-phosphate isomerase [Alphaproteobacteria bacterium]
MRATSDKPPTEPAAASQAEKDLAAARRVFEIEARGLKAAASNLDERFVRALDTLAGIPGRVVVSGMGKSGHVAHKIAATLASTGTPAFFVHPGEASHGDLGMITRDDAVLAISNSGDTAELADIIAHSRRFTIPLVAITANQDSALAEAADVVLVLPDSDEACPMGLAPTTSTTVTLALGDALAIALLERRAFTADEFQLLHPGGQLGRKLLKVADIMHAGDAMPMVAPGEIMADVLVTITAKRFGCAGVADAQGRLLGIITDGDLRRHMAPDLLALTAGDIMTKKPVTVPPQSLVAEALAIMDEKAITSIFVVEDSKPLGIVHIHDILRSGIA